MLAEGYLSIDDGGRIWRHAILNRGVWRPVEPRRAESPGGNGYLRLVLQVDGRLRAVFAHRLVWIAVNGPIPDGMQVNHKDLDRHHNALGNLEIVTPSGNIRHSYAHGRTAPWSRATVYRGRPRVSLDTMDRIRAARGGGRLLREIADEFGLSVSHVHRIVRDRKD